MINGDSPQYGKELWAHGGRRSVCVQPTTGSKSETAAAALLLVVLLGVVSVVVLGTFEYYLH